MPRNFLNLRVELFGFGTELVGDLLQQFDVHANTPRLHAGEDRDEGQFHLFVDSIELPAIDLGAKHFSKTRDQLNVVL